MRHVHRGATTRFINAFQRIGLGSGWGGPKLYVLAMGMPKTMEIMLTGDALESDEAYRVGALNKLVAAEDLLSETMGLAGRLADAAPLAQRDTKQQIREGWVTDLATATDVPTMVRRSQRRHRPIARVCLRSWRNERPSSRVDRDNPILNDEGVALNP